MSDSMIDRVMGRLRRVDVSSSIDAYRRDVVMAAWPWRNDAAMNWGDLLNPYLVEWLSGKPCVPFDRVINVAGRPVYYVVGSGLGQIRTSAGEVWGMGFIRNGSGLMKVPRRIHAVRGPLTAARLEVLGIRKPRVYGDPAALLPMLYKPAVAREYKLGVVCHFRESSALKMMMGHYVGEYSEIDIEAGLRNVVDEINKCRLVISSSLHAIILADAYEIPALWVRFGNGPLGDGFKFQDYFASVGRPPVEPVPVSELKSLQDVEDKVWRGKSMLDGDALLAACPFWDGRPLSGRSLTGIH